jgi:thiol-disulfide isomerase/thioredoxin
MSNTEIDLKVKSTSRRHLVLGLTGAGAALTGAGLAFWNKSSDSLEGSDPGSLWGLEFESPAGNKLAMTDFRGHPILINFWATWCPPCIEELPLLDAFYRQNSSNGWQVLGLAIDKPKLVLDFLRRSPVAYSVAMAGFDGIELSKSLGNTVGGLPFTVVLGSSGKVLQRKIGKISSQDLLHWRELK